MIHNIYRLFKLWYSLTTGIIQPLLWTVAIILAISKLSDLIPFIRKFVGQMISYHPNLAARYGRNSWAVVTGASSGIGEQFAFQLASHQFNIVLVARNEEKLQAVEKEIKSQYPSVQTRIVVEDFRNAVKEEFAERIYEQVKDLDVSLLVNNAGGWKTIPLVEQSTKDVQEVIAVNALAPALLTRVFLPHLAARKKSGMISVTSGAQDFPLTNVQVYSATKVFLDHLTRGLVDENKNVDFLALRPYFVATKLTEKTPGADVIKPEQTVKSALRTLGHAEFTYGHWKHSISGHMFQFMPSWVRRNMTTMRTKKM